MLILLDSCVWGGARPQLAAAGHEVIWAGEWPEDPGDEEILARAHAEGRILETVSKLPSLTRSASEGRPRWRFGLVLKRPLVTLVKDFGELAIVRGTPHSGILRLVNIAARQQAAVCLHAIGQHGAELQAGPIITAEPGRLRLRPPDPPDGTP